jgi:hypothetical protein
MKEIYFGEFRKFVLHYIKLLNEADVEADSVEWFLLKYLRRVVRNTEIDDPAGRVEGSMRSLMRFYVDNIDEHSELGDQCIKIYEEYRKTLRYSQTK